MDYVVVAKGETQAKAVLKEGSLVFQDITPFVGARRNGVCEVGLGFLDQSGQVAQFYAPDFFKNLLQSWRGMHILQQITHIWEGTIRACYKAALPDPSFMERSEFESLRDQIGRSRFDSFLQKMRVILPDPADLDQMIRAMEEAGIRTDIFEIQSEIHEGRLNPTPYLKSIIKQEVDSYKQQNAKDRALHEAEVKRLQDQARQHRRFLLARAF